HTRCYRDWSSDVCSSDLVPALVEAARKDADAFTRVWAITALGKLGPEARDAVPALVESLQDPAAQPANPAQAAVQALGWIGPPRSEERRVGRESGAEGAQ